MSSIVSLWDSIRKLKLSSNSSQLERYNNYASDLSFKEFSRSPWDKSLLVCEGWCKLQREEESERDLVLCPMPTYFHSVPPLTSILVGREASGEDGRSGDRRWSWLGRWIDSGVFARCERGC